MVRALDLKKPPSIAESIDWARALLLLGADDIDRDLFEQTMSIIVKHRTDIDLVAERVGGQLGRAHPKIGKEAHGGLTRPAGLAPRLIGFCEELRSEGVASGPRRSSTPSRRSPQIPLDRARATSARRSRRRSPSPRRTAGSSSCSSTATSSAPPRTRRSSAGSARTALRRRRAARPGRAARGDPAGDRRGQRRRDARRGAARDRRLRPPGRGLGRRRGRRAADPPHARPAGGDARRSARTPPLDREQIQAFERHLRRELERALIERTREAAAVAAARRARPRAADQPHPGPRRRPPRRRPAQAPARDARP